MAKFGRLISKTYWRADKMADHNHGLEIHECGNGKKGYWIDKYDYERCTGCGEIREKEKKE